MDDENISAKIFTLFENNFEKNFKLLLGMNENVIHKIDYLNSRFDNYCLEFDKRISNVEGRLASCETNIVNLNDFKNMMNSRENVLTSYFHEIKAELAIMNATQKEHSRKIDQSSEIKLGKIIDFLYFIFPLLKLIKRR